MARLWWTVPCLALMAAPLQAQAPSGWSATAGVSRDTAVAHAGKASGRLQVGSAEQVATLRQRIRADSLRGHRVRLTGYVRSQLTSGWAGLWMRVDGPGVTSGPGLAFDNMSDRPITGTTDWTPYSVVLDVPDSASVIVLGAMVMGRGNVWLDDVSLETVGPDTPVTDLLVAGTPNDRPDEAKVTPEQRERILTSRREAPVKLQNTGLEESR